MESLFEKVYAVAADKSQILDVYSIGKHIHDSLDCNVENCSVGSFLTKLSDLLNNEFEMEETVRIESIDIATKHIKVFTAIDQIAKKYDGQIFQFKNERIRVCLCYESEKIKSYFKLVNKKQDVENDLFVLEKSFL